MIDANKNCHEYCDLAKHCRYHPGDTGKDPDDCAMHAKIEDLMWDATQEDAEARAERERKFEECEDW